MMWLREKTIVLIRSVQCRWVSVCSGQQLYPSSPVVWWCATLFWWFWWRLACRMCRVVCYWFVTSYLLFLFSFFLIIIINYCVLKHFVTSSIAQPHRVQYWCSDSVSVCLSVCSSVTWWYVKMTEVFINQPMPRSSQEMYFSDAKAVVEILLLVPSEGAKHSWSRWRLLFSASISLYLRKMVQGRDISLLWKANRKSCVICIVSTKATLIFDHSFGKCGQIFKNFAVSFPGKFCT